MTDLTHFKAKNGQARAKNKGLGDFIHYFT